MELGCYILPLSISSYYIFCLPSFFIPSISSTFHSQQNQINFSSLFFLSQPNILFYLSVYFFFLILFYFSYNFFLIIVEPPFLNDPHGCYSWLNALLVVLFGMHCLRGHVMQQFYSLFFRIIQKKTFQLIYAQDDSFYIIE